MSGIDIALWDITGKKYGLPVLYSGDEVGRENDYGYHRDPLKREDSRYLHRGDMGWKKAEKRKNKDTTEGKVFAEICRQEKIRAKPLSGK